MIKNSDDFVRKVSIRDRSLSGIRWSTAQTFFVGLIGPVSQIVKARYLSPREFGVVAVFMIVYGLLHIIENAGIGQTVVQKGILDPSERFTYLFISVVAGLIGFAILLLIAQPIALIFQTPQAVALIRLSGPLLFFALVNQYFRAILNRHLLFRGAVIMEIIKRVLNLVLLLLFLGMGLGPKGVAYAMLLASFVGVCGTAFMAIRSGHMEMKIFLAPSATKHLLNFGVPIAGKQVFTYIAHRADEFVIGIFLNTETLGIYHLAKETMQRLQTLITSSFSRVLLSLFSRIREDRERLTRVYKRISLLVCYFGVSVFVGVTLTADSVVPAVFGTKWIEAVPAFRVLAIALIPIVLTANLSSSLLYSFGRSKSVLLADVCINVPYLFLLIIFGRSGFTPVLILYTVYCFTKGLVLQAMSNRQLTMTIKEHILIYLRVLLRVIVMVVVVLITGLILEPGLSYYIRAIVQVSVGLLTMTLVTILTDRSILKEVGMFFNLSSNYNTKTKR